MIGSDAITKKRWKPRLWQLIVGTIAFLILASFVALLVMRTNGRTRWFAYVEAEQAAGRPISFDLFISQAPAIDRTVQSDWDAWQKLFTATVKARMKVDPLDALSRADRPELDAWVTGHGPLPVTIPKLVTAWERDLAPALASLQTRKLVLSTFRWPAKGSTALGAGGTIVRTGTPAEADSSTLWKVAEWLRHHALLGEDPARDLSGLDALYSAVARTATITDATMANALGYVRDLAYLDLAIRDRLPAPARDTWLAEPCRAVEMIGDGFLGDRISTSQMYVTSLDVGLATFCRNNMGGWNWSQLDQYALMPLVWAAGWDDLPAVSTQISRMGSSLRGDPPTPFPDFSEFRDSLTLFGRYWVAPRCAHLHSYASEAAEREAGNRQARIAVRILAQLRSRGLPADEADLRARLPAAGALLTAPNRFSLRYEQLAADRFRVTIDPVSPIPDFYEAQLVPAHTTAFGSPPATSPLTFARFTEIQVPPTP